MKISVEKKHIAEGLPHNCDRCPIALAVSERLGRYVYVNNGGVYIYPTIERPKSYTDWETAFRLPEKAINFYRAFDDLDPVKPFDFSLKAKIFK